MAAIRAEGLTKRFRRLNSYRDLVMYPWRRDDHLAVDGVSLDVEDGQLFAILGENGAGKTTLIRMLTTSLLPTAGSARVGGFDVVAEPRRVREIIGLVSAEERSFYWRLTGRQNLEFFAALSHVERTVARRRMDDLMATMGIADVADEPFSTYSTGMRHRFSIVRGLLTDPQVLFLDEPTRSLDPLAAAEVRALVRDRLVDEMRRTVLLATHSLAEAEELATKVAILRRGRLVNTGSVAELRTEMGLATRIVIRCRGGGDAVASIDRIPGVLACEATTDGADSVLTIRIGREGETLDRVIRHLVAGGSAIAACETHAPTLEDIYQHAMSDAQRSGVAAHRDAPAVTT